MLDIDSALEVARVDQVRTNVRIGRGLPRVYRTTDDYYLMYPAAGGGHIRHGLPLVTGSGSDGPYGPSGVHMLRGVDHVYALVGVAYAAAAAVETGTWGDSTSGSWTWRRTNTSGDSSTWTTPAGSTSVGLTTARHSSTGGVARVAIDGDFTLAVGLPTAQQLADNGRIATSALTTSGGTLNPAHRCLLTYSTTTAGDIRICLASGLTPAAHVVRVEHSGITRTGSPATNDQRIAVQGYASTTTVQTPTATNLFVLAALSATASAWETATKYAPIGYASSFMGTFHGNHTEDSFILTVDDTPTVLATGQMSTASRSIRLQSTGTLVHPTAGRSADIITTYQVSPAGLRINPIITWTTTGTVFTAYAMMPVTGPRLPDGFTHGTTSGYGPAATPAVTTIGTDVDSATSNTATAVWMWNTRYIALIRLLTPKWQATNTQADRGTVLEQRNLAADTSILKAYITRDTSTLTQVQPGTIHEYVTLTRFAALAPGATPADW